MLVAHLFWDTSALIRRYARTEPGAAQVEAVMDIKSGHEQLISRLLPAEVASTLARKVRTKELGVVERDKSWRLFQADMQRQYQVIELSDQVSDLRTSAATRECQDGAW